MSVLSPENTVNTPQTRMIFKMNMMHSIIFDDNLVKKVKHVCETLSRGFERVQGTDYIIYSILRLRIIHA